jgi:hypothetical protein
VTAADVRDHCDDRSRGLLCMHARRGGRPPSPCRAAHTVKLRGVRVSEHTEQRVVVGHVSGHHIVLGAIRRAATQRKRSLYRVHPGLALACSRCFPKDTSCKVGARQIEYSAEDVKTVDTIVSSKQHYRNMYHVVYDTTYVV